jgi:hypothetical protein
MARRAGAAGAPIAISGSALAASSGGGGGGFGARCAGAADALCDVSSEAPAAAAAADAWAPAAPAPAAAPPAPAAAPRGRDPLGHLAEVHVLLFGAEGRAETEGIYSLRAPGPEGLPAETILAFESRVDAERYCGERRRGGAGPAEKPAPPTDAGTPPGGCVPGRLRPYKGCSSGG